MRPKSQFSREDQQAVVDVAFELAKDLPIIMRKFKDVAIDDNRPMNERIWAYSKIETYVKEVGAAVTAAVIKDGVTSNVLMPTFEELVKAAREANKQAAIKALEDYAVGKVESLPLDGFDATPESSEKHP